MKRLRLRLRYEKVMFTRKTPVKVLKGDFVICQEKPILGSSPDGRIILVLPKLRAM